MATIDVFVVAAFSTTDPAEALRQAIKESGIQPGRIRDFIFGADRPGFLAADELAREVLLNCPQVTVSSSLRALFFAIQAISCGDEDVVLVGGTMEGQSAALMLVAPSVIGIYNLTPLARLDACSLSSIEQMMKKSEHTSDEIGVKLEGACGVLLAVQLIEQLQESDDSLGLIHVGPAAMLLERV